MTYLSCLRTKQRKKLPVDVCLKRGCPDAQRIGMVWICTYSTADQKRVEKRKK